jgi:hypothetical protein
LVVSRSGSARWCGPAGRAAWDLGPTTTNSTSRPSTANTLPSHPSLGHSGSSGSNPHTSDHPGLVPRGGVVQQGGLLGTWVRHPYLNLTIRSQKGIPGGTSTLGYHMRSLGGLSGTQTPLAAVAGGTSFALRRQGVSECLIDRPGNACGILMLMYRRGSQVYWRASGWSDSGMGVGPRSQAARPAGPHHLAEPDLDTPATAARGV